MSVNIIAAWPIAIVGVSDRRLTGFVSGKMHTNRSTKMTVFGCADAHGVVVYNGIGMDDQGLTPGDWLMELGEQKVFDSDIQQVLESVRTDLEGRLQKLREVYGPKKARHTFTFAVWRNDQTEIHNLTNYESFDGGENLAEGSDRVKLIPSFPTPQAKVGILVTGTMPPIADVKAIRQVIAAKPVNYVLARCIKVVRDVAYRRGNARGAVGSAAQWAVVGPQREDIHCGLDVVGGRVAQEPPNMINVHAKSHVAGTRSVGFGSAGAGMLIKDAYAYAVAEDGSRIDIAHYDPDQKGVLFSEPKCGVCGSPWPASHRFCEVCLHDEHHARGKKQRRRR
ncbi:MAG: hypothetical protein LAN83_08930 [Acidobacteriia bacterium]|nr:hypothetical protein [Terriglobia bacterium]